MGCIYFKTPNISDMIALEYFERNKINKIFLLYSDAYYTRRKLEKVTVKTSCEQQKQGI